MRLQRRTETIGAAGVRSFTYTDINTIYAWAQPTGSNVRDQYSRYELTVTHAIYTGNGITIQEGDRIVMADETIYLVHGVKDMSGLNRIRRVDVEEVRV